MSIGDVTETGITWDHDTGEIFISTRRRAVESKLKKLGLKPDREDVGGYTTFLTHEDCISIGFRAKRKLSPEQRARVGARLEKARKSIK